MTMAASCCGKPNGDKPAYYRQDEHGGCCDDSNSSSVNSEAATYCDSEEPCDGKYKCTRL